MIMSIICKNKRSLLMIRILSSRFSGRFGELFVEGKMFLYCGICKSWNMFQFFSWTS